MKDVRIKVATGLMVTVLSVLGGIHVATASPLAMGVRYACEPRQKLVVARSSDVAVVQFVDRTYHLQRKPSSIGVKYASAGATLIVDGRSAVFVAEDRLQLGTCLETKDIASVL